MAWSSNPGCSVRAGVIILLLMHAMNVSATDAGTGWKSPDPEANWFWQLDNEGALELPFDVWDVSLFDVTDNYLHTLKSQGVYIVCYFSLGTSEEYNPDRADFLAADFGQVVELGQAVFGIDGMRVQLYLPAGSAH